MARQSLAAYALTSVRVRRKEITVRVPERLEFFLKVPRVRRAELSFREQPKWYEVIELAQLTTNI